MAPKKTPNASTETASAKTRALKEGTIVGRAAERLLELEAQERDELIKRSPEAIKASYAKKRGEVLADLKTDAQRAGATAMANAMRPIEDKAAAE
jgi:hypothetical protein